MAATDSTLTERPSSALTQRWSALRGLPALRDRCRARGWRRSAAPSRRGARPAPAVAFGEGARAARTRRTGAHAAEGQPEGRGRRRSSPRGAPDGVEARRAGALAADLGPAVPAPRHEVAQGLEHAARRSRDFAPAAPLTTLSTAPACAAGWPIALRAQGTASRTIVTTGALEAAVMRVPAHLRAHGTTVVLEAVGRAPAARPPDDVDEVLLERPPPSLWHVQVHEHPRRRVRAGHGNDAASCRALKRWRARPRRCEAEMRRSSRRPASSRRCVGASATRPRRPARAAPPLLTRLVKTNRCGKTARRRACRYRCRPYNMDFI